MNTANNLSRESIDFLVKKIHEMNGEFQAALLKPRELKKLREKYIHTIQKYKWEQNQLNK